MNNAKKAKALIIPSLRALLALMVLTLIFMTCNTSPAFERYRNEDGILGSNCSACHGGFWDDTSTKGSVFPSDSKHEMHQAFITGCTLCHADSGSKKNPYIGQSGGTANNTGVGCNGCHEAVGLRAHHAANEVTSCAICHPDDGTPPPEGTMPLYYGTADTLANNPCNDVAAANTNENWTIGDFVGLDNDGDNLYDLADFDCGPPYHIVGIEVVSNDVQVSWETVGGRTDILQASSNLTNSFSDVGSIVTNSGSTFVTNSVVDAGGAGNTNRFYRIRYAP